MKDTIAVPSPMSMSCNQAASWYRTMIPLIPKLPVRIYTGDYEHELACKEFKAYWATKSMLRLAAAHALIEQELANEFLTKFHLWSAEEHLGLAYIVGRGKNVFRCAMDILTDVTERERHFYPGTVGESIGMKCHTPDGIYVVTAEGWIKEADSL
ncbi:hypothetical protein OU800_07855 [Pseudomonas sp. GOM7]|uniref:hypothetical protein n=1 Tax=Pseudomonas sp. GOM7 TaxID=2998079 RepID=UPI00227C855F|nr:hypothetical protein [Pseudomonas sp. GOM7]WAJ39130.1 hypothetical protein OU800_07855 [Pseudomonas sp. GOM7]